MNFKNITNRFWYLKLSKSDQKLLNRFSTKISSNGYEHNFPTKAYAVNRIRNGCFPKNWNLEKKIDVILLHYQLLVTLPNFLDVTRSFPNLIIELSPCSDDTVLVCGLPQWPSSQGDVALQLIKNNKVLISVPFTLGIFNSELVIYLWAIQIKSADLTELIPIYKDFGGMRTHDLMIEMLRLLAKKIGAKRILAISDESRKQIYPSQSSLEKMWSRFSNNSIWYTNGGIKLDGDFFNIPIEQQRVSIDLIPGGKRSLFKKRYSLLDTVEEMFKYLKYFAGVLLSAQLLFQVMCGLHFFYTTYNSFNIPI